MNERRLVTRRTDKGPRLKALVVGGLMVVGHGGVMVGAGSTLASTPSSSSINEMTVVAGERCCRSGRQQTDNRQTDRQTDGRPIAYSERNVVR